MPAFQENNAVRGRGTGWNPANRFDQRDCVLDEFIEEAPEDVRPETVLIADTSKTILAHNDSPDVNFDVSINPYRGCEHGCIYCYARPTHEYLGLSAGLDFETRIHVKYRAPDLLRDALGGRSYVPQTIGISGVTDPYQPIERDLKLTRQCLEVLLDHRNPAALITKNRLVARDIDILSRMAEHHCVSVMVSVTTLDLGLNRILEPRTSSPKQRLETIRALRDAGVPVGVLVAPVIPAITDSELPAILEAAAEAGAQRAGYIILRLPLAVAPLFTRWLEQHYPERKEKVLSRVRAMRDGQLSTSAFGKRMRGTGAFADNTQALFEVAVRKLGLNKSPFPMNAGQFRAPGDEQMYLF